MSKILGATLCALSFGASAANAAAPATPQGSINFRTYAGDQRSAIRDRTATPDGSFYPKRAEGPYNGYPGVDSGDNDALPVDVRDNYNMELIGYFYPPKTGRIQFALATDDPGELWLSTDDTPANKRQIATEPTWNAKRNFATEARRTRVNDGTQPANRLNNQSAFIDVVAGKPYFIQSIATEFGGGDNSAIAFRYDGDPDFADGDKPIPGANLSPFYIATAASILGQPKDTVVLAGRSAVLSVVTDIPPPATITSIKWQRNGVDIPNSNSASLTLTPTAADDAAKYKAIITTSTGTLTSSEATLTVASLANEFVQGVVKFEAWTGISGTSVAQLTDSPDFQTPPDDIRLLGALDTPNGYGDNYGVRISGFITPQATGSYRFFIRSDDASQLFLSADDKEAAAVMIAEETGCCDPFRDPGSPETSEPVSLVAGRRYAFYAYVKEGGGGDYLQIAMRNETDTTPAANLQPLTGNLIGANAKINKGDVTITKQPTAVSTEEGRNITLSVDALTTPADLNLPLLVQWQKNGQNIAGATGKNLTLASAKLTDTGKYRAVLSVAGAKTVNTAEVDVTVVTDTAGPLIASGGAVKKGTDTEIGVAFDETVDVTSASAASAYTISKGTIRSVRFVSQSGGAVLAITGVNPGDKVTVTAKGVKDAKGNVRDTTSKEVTVPAKLLTWVGVGGDDLNLAFARTDFKDDVVARNEKDFDLISGGSQHWGNYDEVTFVYEQVTGDFDKVVRLEYQDPVTQWSRSGLMVREALDEGKTKAEADAGYKFSQTFTIRANPPAVLGWDGRTGNNAYEVIHRPVEGGTYDPATYNAMFGIQNSSSSPPAYPNAWLRLKREGQKITSYRSNDGKVWTASGDITYRNDPDSPEDETLTATTFVGIFYGPEFVNISDEEQRKTRSASIAKFRDYGDFSSGGTGTGAIQSVTRSGANVVITFTGSLEQADAITGPWTAVTGTSPLSVTIAGNAKFYRVKK
jgi:hypothetical protein